MSVPATAFLASVASAAEADIALAGGADIIDCKDARRGALGALPVAEVAAIRRAVAGRKPVSAVTGDLPMQPDVVLAAAEAMAASGVDFVKVGLFAGTGRAACIAALAPLAARARVIGVMFADQAPDLALLPDMQAAGFAGAMIDTAGKQGGGLLAHMDIAALDAFVAACRAHGLTSGLAGRLEPPDVPRLLALGPDFLGFRGALCAGRARAGALDPDAVAHIRALIPRRGEGARVPADAPTDRVFLRGFTLPMRIGAYAQEHGREQAVRFCVEVDVAREGGAASDDMRSLYSYDLIVDAIRRLAARRHYELVESVADDLAALLLAHPRALRVRIEVEKPDLGPFRVGVGIERGR